MKKIILPLVVGILISVGVMAYCETSSDCAYLDGYYCDGNLLIEEIGICVDFECYLEPIGSVDCNDDGYSCDGDDLWYYDGYCSGGGCTGEWTYIEDCNDDYTYCDGAEKWGVNGYCSGGSCYEELYLIENCDNNYNYCDGAEVWWADGYCSGGSCYEELTFVEGCNNDYSYCSGSEVIDVDGYCSGGSCWEDSTSMGDCDINYNYCDGAEVWYADGYCSKGSCFKDLSFVDDCNNDYSYCSGDEVWENNGYCDGGGCAEESYAVENCNSYDGFFCNLDEVWESNGYCREGGCLEALTFIEDCNYYDYFNCEDTFVVGEDWYCMGGGCGYEGIAYDCDDGLYCNGQETCQDAACFDGIDIECDDIVGCTNDICNEDIDSCVFTVDDVKCDDENMCTYEYCDLYNDCQYSNEPLAMDCGTCAECDGTGLCIYDELQDSDCDCPNDGCTDDNTDGIIDAFNDYNEAECEAIYTCNECGPTTTEPDGKCKTAMKIPIEQYVSMFSIPLVPDADVTFNDIQNGCNFRMNITYGITYWDPFNEGDDKYVYIDANTILYPGQGYFTTQANECEVIIEGYRFSIDYAGYMGTDNIYEGWNIIGAPSDEVTNFDRVEGNCKVVSGPWGFDAENYEFVRTERLGPGKSYFIKTTSDCNLG